MRRLVVALDYGTSNSGAGYVIVDDQDRNPATNDADIINEWPRDGANRDGSEKVPSDIVYDEQGRPVAYGFEALQHPAPLQWVKLLLEPVNLAEQSDRTSRLWASYFALDAYTVQKKQPVQVVADYLRFLWQRTRAVILEREDLEEDTELFEPTHLTVVLTLPASWSAPAKQRLITAAVLAGIPEQCIKTLAEPEAAAAYGLQKKAKQGGIREGDCVIVCDAGGGTVDVVAYQIRTLKPLSLDQVTVSRADFCGSSFVTKEFLSQLQAMLGEKYDALSAQAKHRIDEDFEYGIKRVYNPTDKGSRLAYRISVPGLEDDEALGIRQGVMELDDEMIAMAFESVMTQIWTLIDDQRAKILERGLEDRLKGLLLVGGFGKSEFLRSRLKEGFSGGPSKPKVWAADNSWTAVVRGAVACEATSIGQEALIHSRLSGYNYGVPYIDDGLRKVRWLVRKGQRVQSNMPTEPYALRIDDQPWLAQDEHCLVYVPIVTSADDQASDLYGDTVTSHAEIRCRVPTALRLSSTATVIQTYPARAWHIPAQLVLYFSGAMISFRCRIENREVGVAEVRYFQSHADTTTEEDHYGDEDESEPPTPSAAEKKALHHFRADSGNPSVSNVSLDSEKTAGTVDSKVRKTSASTAMDIAKETGGTTQPANKEDKKRHRHLWGTKTKRDRPASQHYLVGFLAPSAAEALPREQRLDAVYRRGWTKRV